MKRYAYVYMIMDNQSACDLCQPPIVSSDRELLTEKAKQEMEEYIASQKENTPVRYSVKKYSPPKSDDTVFEKNVVVIHPGCGVVMNMKFIILKVRELY